MNLHVVNECVRVGAIHITAVASSSVFLIGDTEEINLSSIFDTPPEALYEGPLVPLSPER